MKYIPGSAKLTLGNYLQSLKTPHYEVYIEGEISLNEAYTYDILKYPYLSELRILLLSYLSKRFIQFNSEFSISSFNFSKVYENKVIVEWLKDEGWLSYDKEYGMWCKRIHKIEIVYFNEDRDIYKVNTPNIDELFDSEEEFLEYIEKLIIKEEFNNY